MAQAVRKKATSSRRTQVASAPRAPIYTAPPNYGITANVSCRASLEEIAALGPARCMAFMAGVAEVLSVLNPRTPVGGQSMR